MPSGGWNRGLTKETDPRVAANAAAKAGIPCPKSGAARTGKKLVMTQEHYSKKSAAQKKYCAEHPEVRYRGICRGGKYHYGWIDGRSYLLKLNGELKPRKIIFKELFEKQNGVCAICGKPEIMQLRGKVRKLCIDHDHITGEVRGLLCQKCNKGLGMFMDSIEFLLQAIKYLQK